MAAAWISCLTLGCSLDGFAGGAPRGAGGASSASSATSGGSSASAGPDGGAGGAEPSAFAWIRGLGNEADQVTMGAGGSALFTASGSDRVVLAAHTDSALDFGGGLRGTPSVHNAFLASFSADGEHQFSLAFDGTAIVDVKGVAVAGDGRIAVVGSFKAGTLRAAGAELSNASRIKADGYLAVFDASGAPRDARRFKEVPGMTASHQAALGVAYGPAGDLFVAGSFVSSVEVSGADGAPDAPCTLDVPSATEEAFVMKLDPALSCVWAQRIGTSLKDERATAVAAAPDGDVVVGGVYRGALPLPNGATLPSPRDNDDGFVLRFDPAGALRWAARVGSTGPDSVTALAADEQSVYVAGVVSGDAITADRCQGALPAQAQDVIAAKLSATDGACAWLRQIGGTDVQTTRSIALSATSIALGCSFKGELAFARDAELERLEEGKADFDAALVWLDRGTGDLVSHLARRSSALETFDTVSIGGSAVFLAGTYAQPFDGLPAEPLARDFFLGRLAAPAP